MLSTHSVWRELSHHGTLLIAPEVFRILGLAAAKCHIK